MAAPVIALAVPILDTALAIVRRFVRGEPIFAADRGHIHHRLLARGFSPRRVAGIFYAGAGFFACMAILLTAGTYSRGPVLAAFCIVIWLALRYLRYDELDSVGRVIFQGVLRDAVTTDIAVRELEAAVRRAQSVEECWMAVKSNGGRLGLGRATMQVYGKTFAAEFGEPGERWSLRVPLNGGGAMDLEVPFGTASAGVAAFADSVRRTMAPKLESLRPLRAFAAAAGRR
jgi:UDP-GlcNAc:undecaprenyl-phosphate GlcNAc-1-phosphate transferase